MRNGWFKLWRKVWDEAPRPFNSWMAWLWLIAHAEYSGENRGSICATYEDLACQWGWTKNRVRKQITRWESGPNEKLTKKLLGRAMATRPAANSAAGSAAVIWRFSLVKYTHYNPPQEDSAANSAACSATPSAAIWPRCHSIPYKKKEEEQEKRTCVLETKPPEKTKRKPVKHKETDPNIKILFDFFFDNHREIRGFKYVPVNGGHDAKCIQGLLSALPDPEEIKTRMVRYLRDDQKWRNAPEWTIPQFKKRINAYAQEVGGRTRKESDLEKLRKMRRGSS